MKKTKDPNTGVIKYVPDESDMSLLKLSREVKKLSMRIKDLENRVSELEGRDI